ncbi:RHS repeat-associated core domain-containing protein [Burkholderia cepacia]|uniref:RHS repeat-associated core domain-containing protein n=1 Tax=Burkholderia cepacia TaxID=292 RepID=UPI00398F5691
MALPAVKHLDPVVGVDVHSVLVTPGTPPVFLPHPHVGFMLDKREYIQAAKAVVGCIAMMIVQEKVTEYIEEHPEDVKKLEHLADEANQQVNKQLNDLMGGGKLPDFKDDPTVAEGMKLANEANKIKNRISDDLGSNVGSGGGSGRPIFVNGMMRATAGTHAYHVPGLHFPLGESFVPPPAENPEPSNDGESFMGSKTVLANNDPMSYMALEALSCWSVGMEPPPHNSAHTDRTYPSMPSSVMLPIPAGRPVLVGGPPIMNMAAAAKGLFKAFQGSKWAKALADKLNLKSGFLRCNVLKAEPVDAITGEVVVQQHDFTVSGRLPLVWARYYASQDNYAGSIGVGWQTPADIRMTLMERDNGYGVVAHFPDHATAFDALPADSGWPDRVYDWQHGHALYRRDDRLVLRTRASIEYEFTLAASLQRTVDAIPNRSTLSLLVSRVADLNGNAWEFERQPYHGLTRLVELQGDAMTGRVIECTSGSGISSGLIVALTLIDTTGRAHPLVGYEHDHIRNLTAAIDAMTQPHHFGYAGDHRMVRHTSAGGVSFYYSYQWHNDGVWRVDHAWGDNGLFDYRFAYDVEHHETRITDSLGHTSVLQANERRMPIARIDPLGGVWSYRYDAQGRSCAETDPAARTTTWSFDPYGNLLAQTLRDRSVVRVEYNADHKPVRVTDTGERHWQYTWDERGNLLEAMTPAQAYSRYDYDIHGQVVTYTGPRGAVTRYGYDRDGNLTEIVNALGHRTVYTCDARSNVTETVNALGQVSRYEYDRNGNLTRAIEPGDRETIFSYDSNGNLVCHRDPNDQFTRLEYSPLGQITKRLTPDGGAVEYRYDTEERLIGVVNERCELYQLKRDALGRIVEEIDYWGQPHRYEYDATGDLLRTIDALGQAIDYESDARGRIIRKHVPDPRRREGRRTETFSYDRSGNLVVAENPDCRVERKYDAAARLVEERQGEDFVITNMYDIAGNNIERQTRLNANGKIVTHSVRYGYDALNAVSSIQMDDATPMAIERDALGQIRVEHLAAELRRELSYTSEGLLAKQVVLSGTNSLFASEYVYDANGELIEKCDSRFGIERYQYDPVGRLTGHLDPTGKFHHFQPDPAGDLLKTRIRQGRETALVGQGQLTETWIRDGEYDDCYYAFDRVGNLVLKKDPTQDLILRWDGNGLLIETMTVRHVSAAVRQSDHTLNTRTQYSYDVFHRRTKKVTQIQYGIATQTRSKSSWTSLSRTSCFFWDGDALMGETTHDEQGTGRRLPDSTGNFSTDTITDLTHMSPRTEDGYIDAMEWVYYPNSFMPVSLLACGQPLALTDFYYYFNDPNGCPIALSKSNGDLVWEALYNGRGGANVKSEEIHNPIRLQGQYEDDETRLCYNRHRYYDATCAQFISRDPLGIFVNENLYAYASNVFSGIDPLGLIDLQIRGLPGNMTVHANPGPNAVAPGARADHIPLHVHLGSDKGPRVKVATFIPYSDSDKKKMTRKQEDMVKNLTNKQKNLIRRRAKSVFKRGCWGDPNDPNKNKDPEETSDNAESSEAKSHEAEPNGEKS